MDFARRLASYAGQPLTRQILMEELRGYKRPFDKIHELVKQGMLLPVKRGIFIPGPQADIARPERFLLAAHLLGPSYVSADSALAYWGLIPERVSEVVSMTTNSAKLYKTAVGRFRYIKLPLPYYAFGIQRVDLAPNQVTLVASREKALCDTIITTAGIKLRSVRQAKEYLMEDLRIDRDQLVTLDVPAITSYLQDAPKKESIAILTKTLKQL